MIARLALFTFAIVVILGSGTPARSQAALALKYPFTVGQTLVMAQIESEQSQQRVQGGSDSIRATETQALQVWHVDEVTPANDFVVSVRYVFQRMTLQLAPGVSAVVDVGRPVADTNLAIANVGDKAKVLLDSLESLRQLLATAFHTRTFRYVFSPNGVVRSVSGFDAAWDDYRRSSESLIPDKASRASLDALIDGLFGGDAAVKTLTLGLFVPLPSGPVALGQRWSDSTQFRFPSSGFSLRRDFTLEQLSRQADAFRIGVSATIQPPSPTEELEFTLPKSEWTGQLTVDPSGGTLLFNSFTGQLALQTFRRGSVDHNPLNSVTSTASGSVTIAPIARFVADIGKIAERAFLRQDFLLASEFDDQCYRVDPEPRFSFSLAVSLEQFAKLVDFQSAIGRSLLRRATDAFVDVSTKKITTREEEGYRWMALHELVALHGSGREPGSALANSASKRLAAMSFDGTSRSETFLGDLLAQPRRPESALLYYDIGSYLAMGDDLTGSLAAYTSAVEEQPRFALAFLGRGLVNERLGKPADAEYDYSQCLSLDPTIAEGYFDRAVLRLEQSAFLEASQDLRAVIRVEPASGIAEQARLLLWLARSNAGEREQATVELRESLAFSQIFAAQPWVSPVGEFLVGQRAADALVLSAETSSVVSVRTHLSDVYFFVGARSLLDGDKPAAYEFLMKSVTTGQPLGHAYRLAASLLAQRR
jgi:tetratricopeptide (TPR) repeat protein